MTKNINGQNFRTWQEVKVGTVKSKKLLIEALTKKYQLNKDERNAIVKNEFMLRKREAKISLVKITVKELGFTDGASTQEIFTKASAIGLKLCPHETAMQLLINSSEENIKGDWLYISSKLIVDEFDRSIIFRIGHSTQNGLCLDAVTAYPKQFFPFCYQWIFRK